MRAGDVSAVELAEIHLRRVEQTAATVNAVVWHDREATLCAAKAADKRRRRGEEAPLLGLPVTIKESIDLADSPTTLGEPLFANHRAGEDAPVVARLRAAGAVIVGKTPIQR